MKEKSRSGGTGGMRGQKSEAKQRWYDTVRPWRTDVETIEARYTSESLFALMAYVWKREGRQGETERRGVGVLSGHPYAYYAFAPRSVTPCRNPVLLFPRCLSLSGPRSATPPVGWVTRRAN